MSTGYFIRIGDKTSCGGTVLSGSPAHSIGGLATARQGDAVSCGKNGKKYSIAGGVPDYCIHGIPAAGTLHSRNTCPCRARLIASVPEASYWAGEEKTVKIAPVSAPLSRTALAKAEEPVQHAQVANKANNSTSTIISIKERPESLPLPYIIFTTKHRMDDYNSPDMKHSDLTEMQLKIPIWPERYFYTC